MDLPPGQVVCPSARQAQDAETPAAGASAALTAELPQKTFPNGGSGTAVGWFPGGGPGAPGLPGVGLGGGRWGEEALSGEALRLPRLRTHSTDFLAPRVAGNSSHCLGLRNRGEGAPQG